MNSSVKKHYHWIVAAIVFLEMLVFGGMINSISIYTIPIAEELSVSRGAYTLAGIPYGLFSFISSLFTGFLLHKWGYKITTICSLILSAIGYFLLSIANGLLVHAIGRALMGLAYGACFTAGAVWITKKWFRKHLGLVIGIITMASGLGGSIMSFIFSRLMVSFGWRTALQIESILPILVSLLYLLIYDEPEKISLSPYGKNQAATKQLRQENNWVGHSLKELYKHPLFYLMCLTTLLSNMCVYTTSANITPHFQDNGYSPTDAAAYNGVLMLTLAVVKLLMGWISDRFGAKPVAITCLICAATGQWMMTNLTNPYIAYISVIIFSVGLCLTSVAIPLIALPLFGYKGSTEINGIVVAMSALASLITPTICNYIYDFIGTYSPTFKVSAIIEIVLIFIYLIMFVMADKDREKEKTAQK